MIKKQHIPWTCLLILGIILASSGALLLIQSRGATVYSTTKYQIKLYAVHWENGNDPDGFRVKVSIGWGRLYGSYWGPFSSDASYDDNRGKESIYSKRYYGDSGDKYPDVYSSTAFAVDRSANDDDAMYIAFTIQYYHILGFIEDSETLLVQVDKDYFGSSGYYTGTGWQHLSKRNFDISINIVIYYS